MLKQKNNFKVVILVAVIILVPILLYLIIVKINDQIAEKVRQDLVNLPLPEKTELVSSASFAGKLIGNGNGMQYFGAICLKSDLSLEELEQYYALYRQTDFDYQVEISTDQNTVNFLKCDAGDYLVYDRDNTNRNLILTHFDLRGN